MLIVAAINVSLLITTLPVRYIMPYEGLQRVHTELLYFLQKTLSV